MDQSDFDWSDTDKMLEKASIAFLNGLRKNPEIRYSTLSMILNRVSVAILQGFRLKEIRLL
jgi:hypothetical protein